MIYSLVLGTLSGAPWSLAASEMALRQGLFSCPLVHRAPLGRVEAGHAASRVWLSIGWPSAWYRARHRGPWKTAIVPSGYSWTRTLALT